MKGWLKLLVLGAVPILAVTMVADQGFAANADKGSQLIFIADMNMKNFISVTNTSVNVPDLDTMDVNGTPTDTDASVDQMAETGMAVTVLVQIYDDSITPMIEYLRVITAGSTVLFDPFDHMIPGTEMNVSGLLGDGDGSRYLIAVTTVRAAEALFPEDLVEGMHETNNIDAVGEGGFATAPQDEDAAGLTDTNGDGETDEADTTKNVGDLSVDNAVPAAFNYLTGHQTSAQVSSATGGADQTASWGVNALTRMAQVGTAGTAPNGPGYETLVAMISDSPAGDNRLMEVIHGGDSGVVNSTAVEGYTLTDGTGSADSAKNITVTYGGVNWGALVWASLHGGAHQEAHLISVADDMAEAGQYKLIPATTYYKVVPHDAMGRVFAHPGADDPPIFRGGEEMEMEMPSPDIRVSGIMVMINPDEDCGGTATGGGFSLADLTTQVPGIGDGNDDFTGVNEMVDPMMNGSMGWIKLLRHTQACEVNYGDGDGPNLTQSEVPDGVPIDDKREMTTGTLVLEPDDNSHTSTNRSFVTSGFVTLTFETPETTFGAAWSLTDK